MVKYSTIANIDFETYSAAGYCINSGSQKRIGSGLEDVGIAKYSEHFTTDVLCAAFKLPESSNIEVWLPEYELPVALFNHIRNGGLLCAFNIAFEFWIWENVCVKRYGWMSLREYQAQLRCTQAAARAYALPGSLEKVARVLGTQAQKDKRGKQLIDLFSKPHPQALVDSDMGEEYYSRMRRVTFQDDPASAQEMINYCVQDVRTEIAVAELIPPLREFELEYWQCDQARNRRGVTIDAEAVENCIMVVDDVLASCAAELKHIIGDNTLKTSSIPKIAAWLRKRTKGFISNLAASNVVEYLKYPLPPDVRRVLEIRQSSASTSIKKLHAMRRRLCDNNRVYELFSYHTARTGRASGNSVQPQNLPAVGAQMLICENGHYSKIGLQYCAICEGALHPTDWCIELIEETLEYVKLAGFKFLTATRGDVLKAISGCLRGLFIAARGHRFICSDYSAIEAVVIAQLAGEEWRTEVFKTHGKIYESSASKISGVAIDIILSHKETTGVHHSLRKLGKVAELASAYQGWVGAWKAFGADEYFTDERELKKSILAWRDASPNIVALWSKAQAAAIRALKFSGKHEVCDGIYYIYDYNKNALFCRLLSNRLLTYHNPRIAHGERGEQLVFDGWNSDSSKGAVGWVKLETYGGKLVENIVQAVARDILAHAVVQLERAGYPVVLDVHDEIVCEVEEGVGSLADLERIMSGMPAWAEGWAIRAAGGWEGRRYRK